MRRFDSMDVIVNFVVLWSPPQTCIRFREKFLDNATAWAIDSTNVIDTFLFDSCSPPQTCRRFKEKIVGQPRWLGSWLNKCHWHILLNDSLLLFYSPPQTCKRFKEKTVREWPFHEAIRLQFLALRCGWKIVQSSVCLVRRFALEKNVVNSFWMSSLAPMHLGRTSVIVISCCDIRKQFRSQLFWFFLLTQRAPIARFESASRWFTLVVWLCLSSAKLGNGYWMSC